jgi:hypothetical protein
VLTCVAARHRRANRRELSRRRSEAFGHDDGQFLTVIVTFALRPTLPAESVATLLSVYVPFYASWLNRIEGQFTELRYFGPDGTDHANHEEEARMIRRYIAWRNRNAQNRALQELVKRPNVA